MTSGGGHGCGGRAYWLVAAPSALLDSRAHHATRDQDAQVEGIRIGRGAPGMAMSCSFVQIEPYTDLTWWLTGREGSRAAGAVVAGRLKRRTTRMLTGLGIWSILLEIQVRNYCVQEA